MKPEIKEKIRKNLPKMLSFFFFFGVITILPLMTIILPKKEFSEIENRVLSKAPEFSFSSVLDRSFMKNSESYFEMNEKNVEFVDIETIVVFQMS